MSNTQQIEKFIIEFDDLKEEIDSLIDSLKEGIESFTFRYTSGEELLYNVNADQPSRKAMGKAEGAYDILEERITTITNLLETENDFMNLIMKLQKICSEFKNECTRERQHLGRKFNSVVDVIRTLIEHIYTDPHDKKNQIREIESSKVFVDKIQSELKWRIQLEKEHKNVVNEKESFLRQIQWMDNSINDYKKQIAERDRELEYERREKERIKNELIDTSNELSKINTELERLREDEKKAKEAFNKLKDTYKEQENKVKEMKKKMKQFDIFYNLNEEQRNLLEKWTGKEMNGIVFDSLTMDCGINTSQLDAKVLSKSQLVFLIEDTNGRKFGGYVNTKIHSVLQWIYDEKAFVFTFVNNSKIKPGKYPCSKPSNAFNLSHRGTIPFLFLFGGNGPTGHDITVRKPNYTEHRSYCHQECCYNYHGKECALIGEKLFDLKRLLVIQMI